MALVTHSQQKKHEGGGGFVPAGTIFSAQSVWCLCVGTQHHFWQSTVGEVNWLCRPANQANKQSVYLDVYGLNAKQFDNWWSCEQNKIVNHCQCDQMARLFFNICSFTAMETVAYKIYRRSFIILPNTKQTLKILPRRCYQSGEISPNLVTLIHAAWKNLNNTDNVVIVDRMTSLWTKRR